MKTACSGGSSSVFSSALKAPVEQHVDLVDDVDLLAELRRRELDALAQFAHSSTPRLLAASISTTSSAVPLVMATQASQIPHGSGRGPSVRQFRHFARMRATEVLPVPRGPEKR